MRMLMSTARCAGVSGSKAYWVNVTPNDLPDLHLKGGPCRAYFEACWNEIWRRGAPSTTGVNTTCLRPGRSLQVGDGARPLMGLADKGDLSFRRLPRVSREGFRYPPSTGVQVAG